MVPRYARPQMTALWEPEARFKIWFEIEAHAATKMAELGVIPQQAADAIWAKGKDATFDADRIDEIARMLAGDTITDAARAAAEALLNGQQGATTS